MTLNNDRHPIEMARLSPEAQTARTETRENYGIWDPMRDEPDCHSAVSTNPVQPQAWLVRISNPSRPNFTRVITQRRVSLAMSQPKKLKVALAGLGRMGKKHAMNLRNLGTKIDFVAAFSITPSELLWAKDHLEPYGVLLYDDYEQMMYHPGLQAIVIATAAAVHKPEVLRAIDLDLHVLCEKPLSTDFASVGTIHTPHKKHD